MNARCKPGDMAIVIEAQNLCNLGLIVRVVRCQGDADQQGFKTSNGVVWECECATPMVWIRNGRQINALSGPIPDHLLQPIRGLKRHELEDSREKTHSA